MEASQQIPSLPVLLAHPEDDLKSVVDVRCSNMLCVCVCFFSNLRNEGGSDSSNLTHESDGKTETGCYESTGSFPTLWSQLLVLVHVCDRVRVCDCVILSLRRFYFHHQLCPVPFFISFVLFLWFHVSVASIFAPAPWLRKFLHLKRICCSVLNVCIRSCFRFFCFNFDFSLSC